MAFQENGKQFTETIEVDEEQGVVVFRVPAHNNFQGADFYQDFNRVSSEGFIQSSILYCPVKRIAKTDTDNTLSQNYKNFATLISIVSLYRDLTWFQKLV